MTDPREKNAEIVRAVVAQADLDGLERFMSQYSQYSRTVVVEWLIAAMPPVSRKAVLHSLMTQYASELSGAVQ
jgi:hypothetical protein